MVSFTKNNLKVDGNNLKLLRKPNLDYLSESDLECLNISIDDNINLSFRKLKDKSHDKAYKSTKDENDEIYVDIIAEALDNSKDVKNYLNNLY